MNSRSDTRRAVRPAMAGLLLLAFSATAHAQSPLSLADAVERALGQHPSIAISRARQDAARAGVDEARAAALPNVQLASSAVQYKEASLVSPIHGLQPGLAPPFDETLFQTGVSASYILYEGGSRKAGLVQARAELDVEEAGSQAARQQLIGRVVGTYARVLSRREIVMAQNRRMEALESERARVERLLDVGRAAEIDRLRVAAALASAAAEQVRAVEALDTAERDLARLLQVPPDETRASHLVPVEVAPVGPEGREVLLDAARRANPLVEQARRREAAARAAVGVASAQRQPRLSVAGSVINFGSAAGHFTTEWNASLQVSYPIFNRAAGERVRRAEATRLAAAGQLRLAETQVAEELDHALSAVREAAALSASLASAVERFTEVARIEALRLENGAGTQTDYLKAESDLLLARSALAEARSGETVARVELARISGELDRNWIRQNVKVKP